MQETEVLVIGGGAAGYFGAVSAAEARPGCRVVLLERGPQPLAKVRISGGGRCNVTHSCFEPRDLSARYPRGARPLLAAFARFQPADTVRWFESRGVSLKTEPDGRMFPTTDQSETIIACLQSAAHKAGVEVRLRAGVNSLRRTADGLWEAGLSEGHAVRAGKVLVATGGCKPGGPMEWLAALGHEVVAPVPSLFTFHIEADWVRALAGLSVPNALVSIPGTGLQETGPVLFTHWGLSGPGILRLSAWGARELAAADYHFPLRVRWCPSFDAGQIQSQLQATRAAQPGKTVANTPLFGLPARLWETLVELSGVVPEVRWNQLPKPAANNLMEMLLRTELPVSGKSMNKDEFVTCGGVSLREIDFRTMQSRLHAGLHLAGEVLDLDGITGGFNFQAAWTTGWIAGRAMAGDTSG
jgi:predicted Rossmann fold flavoprotein